MVGRSLITQLMLKMMTGIVAVRGFRIESENWLELWGKLKGRGPSLAKMVQICRICLFIVVLILVLAL